jgi:hypothetical protein
MYKLNNINFYNDNSLELLKEFDIIVTIISYFFAYSLFSVILRTFLYGSSLDLDGEAMLYNEIIKRRNIAHNRDLNK